MEQWQEAECVAGVGDFSQCAPTFVHLGVELWFEWKKKFVAERFIDQAWEEGLCVWEISDVAP